MSLKKGYLSQKNQITISRRRLFVGLFIALGLSIGLYSMICSIRVFGIILSNDFINNGPILISAENRYWQNLSFALISLAIGHSIFLITLFTKPLKFNLPEINRSRVINNQVFLSFNFYWLFFKVFLLLIFIIASEVFYHFKSYYLLFYLFALVLFLESWKAILLIYRKRVYRYMFLNASVILILAFLLAFTSIFNINRIDKALQSSNPITDLPVIKKDDLLTTPYYRGNFYIIKLLKENNQITYYLDGQKYDNIKALHKQIKKRRDLRSHFPFGVIKLYAPANIQMAEVNKIRRLAFNLFYNFGVQFVFSHSEVNKNDMGEIYARDWFDQDKTTAKNLDIHPDIPPPPIPPAIEIKNEYLITISVENEQYFINNKLIDTNKLESEFLKFIDEFNTFHLIYSEFNTNYEQYLVVYSAYRRAVEKLRNQAQKVELLSENFRYTNRTEYDEDQIRVKTLYPIRFVENNHRKIKILDEN